ncbi:MAG: hypothetical protein JO097_16780 [Acidobacteriaceae bacterium]|nr:hypothetical protein [Acidobacteriaceae bacterium]MBV9294661.1 hypothetical protein [Acidobacteriaceae bacterium]MBV9763984.1 hypothetical protein [Acidobacteriaceae bacterium]
MKFLYRSLPLIVFGSAISQAQNVIPAERLVDRLVQQARESGESSIGFPAQSRDYPIVKSLNEALKLTVPIRLQVDRKKTSVSLDGNQLITLYTVQTIENTAKVALSTLPPHLDDVLPRSAFSDLPEDRFYVLTHGGSLTINGVLVSAPESPSALTIGAQYLLFVRLEHNRDNTLTRIATLPLGDASIYNYNTATDSLETPASHENPELVKEVMSQTMSRLRTLSASRPFPNK